MPFAHPNQKAPSISSAQLVRMNYDSIMGPDRVDFVLKKKKAKVIFVSVYKMPICTIPSLNSSKWDF